MSRILASRMEPDLCVRLTYLSGDLGKHRAVGVRLKTSPVLRTDRHLSLLLAFFNASLHPDLVPDDRFSNAASTVAMLSDLHLYTLPYLPLQGDCDFTVHLAEAPIGLTIKTPVCAVLATPCADGIAVRTVSNVVSVDPSAKECRQPRKQMRREACASSYYSEAVWHLVKWAPPVVGNSGETDASPPTDTPPDATECASPTANPTVLADLGCSSPVTYSELSPELVELLRACEGLDAPPEGLQPSAGVPTHGHKRTNPCSSNV